MLNKQNRLLKDSDFKYLFSKGFYQSGPEMTLRYIETKQKESRFGIVISSKVSKKAVLRNKVKRRLRDIIKKKHDKIKMGYDIVVILKKRGIDANFARLDLALETLLKKARLYDTEKK